MEGVHLVLRQHREKDLISLYQYAQILNLYGTITSLYHLSPGQVWDRAEVLHLEEQIRAHSLKFELMDSSHIHEDTKQDYASRNALIENYRKNIHMLTEYSIRTICHNFMSVFDWTRTGSAHVLPDDSDYLSFEEEKVRAVDPKKGVKLSDWGTNHVPMELQALLHSYRGTGEEELWDSCRYFLQAVLPVVEECGVRLILHPDDPPRFIFSLPRIAKNATDYRRILFTTGLNSPSNIITFYCGSPGSDADNDLPAMIREFGFRGRLPLAHSHNIQLEPSDDFHESGYQTGCSSSDTGGIMRALYDMDQPFCLHPDHGWRIWDEAWSIREVTDADGTQRVEHRLDDQNDVKSVTDYGLFDRALGTTYTQGFYEDARREQAAQSTGGRVRCVK